MTVLFGGGVFRGLGVLLMAGKEQGQRQRLKQVPSLRCGMTSQKKLLQVKKQRHGKSLWALLFSFPRLRSETWGTLFLAGLRLGQRQKQILPARWGNLWLGCVDLGLRLYSLNPVGLALLLACGRVDFGAAWGWFSKSKLHALSKSRLDESY
jgi:hypothetical protein